jgi:hypothetical protein
MSTSFRLSLPIDIPWRRRCVSTDMVDTKLCDRQAPHRWRSSLAIFEYEPDEENQQHEGMTISYLKVVCSITGYQEDPNEIGLNRRGLKNFWGDQDGIEDYVNVLQKYYACYGAILEVTVGPANREAPVKNFPFFMDFEPKKRELYEVATDTKERQSRSIESLNVTKSSGNMQSLEVFDIDMGGGGHSQQASFAGTGGGYSYQAPNGQWGTKRMNADESMQARSIDVGQEKRESYAFSTQISQLYHQLDSYHLGTNRAVFFMLPRPHTLESEHTFVNGMRNIEGVQEFFLVVARPKDTAPVCVEAYLETGHIGKVPRWENEVIPGTEIDTLWNDAYQAKPLGNDDETTVYDDKDRFWYVSAYYPGYKIIKANLTSPGATIRYNKDKPNLIDLDPFISLQNADLIRVSGKVHSGFANYAVGSDRWEEIYYPFTVHITVAKVQAVERSTDTLFITGRSLCCCDRSPLVHIEGIVYERDLKLDYVAGHRRIGPGVPVAAANQMRDSFKAAMMASRVDLENRYGTGLRLAQTSFASSALSSLVNTEKLSVKDANLPRNLASKLNQLRPDVGLHQLLAMPYQMQRELFDLSHDEVLELRRVITGTAHAVSDPKDKWLSQAAAETLFKRRPTKG